MIDTIRAIWIEGAYFIRKEIRIRGSVKSALLAVSIMFVLTPFLLILISYEGLSLIRKDKI